MSIILTILHLAVVVSSIKKVSFQEHNLDARYDITYGRISDIGVLDVSHQLDISGKMLMSIDDILNKDYPFQYAFHTKKGDGLY